MGAARVRAQKYSEWLLGLNIFSFFKVFLPLLLVSTVLLLIEFRVHFKFVTQRGLVNFVFFTKWSKYINSRLEHRPRKTSQIENWFYSAYEIVEHVSSSKLLRW